MIQLGIVCNVDNEENDIFSTMTKDVQIVLILLWFNKVEIATSPQADNFVEDGLILTDEGFDWLMIEWPSDSVYNNSNFCVSKADIIAITIPQQK